MTTCDHGIRLDAWCADCESAFTFRDEPATARRRSGLIAAVALLLALALVAVPLLVRWAR